MIEKNDNDLIEWQNEIIMISLNERKNDNDVIEW